MVPEAPLTATGAANTGTPGPDAARARGAAAERREALRALAERTGALLATSAVARGLFRGDAFDLDVSGGFASPVAASLIREADLLVGWGCSLNMWTLRHGALVGADTTVVQIDLDHDALGAHRPIDLGLVGDVTGTALAVERELARRGHTSGGAPLPALAERLTREVRWRDVPYDDDSGDGLIDPRTLSMALDELLPAERTVAVDSGNFMGYPAMYLEVPDGRAGLHAGVPVDRAGAGHGHRRGDRAARTG